MSGERGLAVVPPQGVAPAVKQREERRRLLAHAIMRGGSEAQVDLVMAICDRYGLDPLLKHIVLINGQPYVTRDGLLHVAHQSGQFDGIEVELAQVGQEWAATCTIWRKDMGRPFRYTAYEQEHKQGGGGAWGKYPRAMLTKAAEVMCLRRAFAVALSAVEELGYDGSDPSSSLGRVVVINAAEVPSREVRDGDPVAAGRVAGDPAGAGQGPDALAVEANWTDFWRWARARGFRNRADLDAAYGGPTAGLTPWEIADGIMRRAAGGPAAATVPATEGETGPPPGPGDRAMRLLDYLGQEGRSVAQQSLALKWLFALAGSREEAEAFHFSALELAAPGLVNEAFAARVEALGRELAVEGEVVEDAPNGQPGDAVPF